MNCWKWDPQISHFTSVTRATQGRSATARKTKTIKSYRIYYEKPARNPGKQTWQIHGGARQIAFMLVHCTLLPIPVAWCIISYLTRKRIKTNPIHTAFLFSNFLTNFLVCFTFLSKQFYKWYVSMHNILSSSILVIGVRKIQHKTTKTV